MGRIRREMVEVSRCRKREHAWDICAGEVVAHLGIVMIK